MLRRPGLWAFYSLHSPLHSPFRPSFGVSQRQVHDGRAPFSGPPSYDTISWRLSSDPSPASYFIQKRQQEAKDRGEFVDIHDIVGIDPKDYDVLITDVDDEKLRTEVADILKLVMVLYTVGVSARYSHVPSAITAKPIGYFFIFDTGAPLTYLSARACNLLGIKEHDRPTTVRVAGHYHPVHMPPKNSHFANLNILGADFSSAYDVSLWYDHPK
ncbi:MAG: hypothetical protein M1840_005798 [Geoglossum simile]|nr:MAG: hypothetical protein M1840_005798 [Geoglossum simile]